MRNPTPRRILIESGCEQYTSSRRILDLAAAQGIDVLNAAKANPPPGRRDLVLRETPGRWIRPFRDVRGEFFLTSVQGCPWRCHYCYLQGYLDEEAVVFFVNTGDLRDQLEAFLDSPEAAGSRLHAAHLGELAPWEKWTGLCALLIDGFRNRKDSKLEIRTKWDRCEELLSCSPPKNVVLSWTLTPSSIAADFEPGLPGTDDRIAAAVHAAREGAVVGIRLDPVILSPGWRKAYADLAKDLGEAFVDQTGLCVEIGGFRCPKKAARAMRQSKARALLGGEMILGSDGKYRYFWPLRVEAYRFIAERMVSALGRRMTLDLCMEPRWVRDRSLGDLPHP